jgi:uncharacterized protein
MELLMILFLLTVLCLYGGINFYVFFRARNIFNFSGAIQILLLFLLVLLILAPVIVRLAEHVHLEKTARVIAYIGYLWMAFVFLLFFLNISLDILRFIAGFFYPGAKNAQFIKIIFAVAALVSIGLVVYGFFDAQRIRIKKLEIHTNNILAGGGKIRIAQISDVHVGLIVRGDRLESIIDLVRQTNPDILISTGDLLDGELDNVMAESQRFVSVNARLGKYAIMGNHEYYGGIDRAMEFTRKAGFEILRDQIKQVGGITIFGADDVTARRMGIPPKAGFYENLNLPGRNTGFALLLKHQPFINDKENFNLQLSGHAHGGQIFPFTYIVRFFFHRYYGYYQLGENKILYISRGAGTWGPPVRLLAPPEITVIDIMGKKSD